MGVLKIDGRLGEENVNHQGCSMKIVEYIDSRNVIVQFQDETKFKVRATYSQFQTGQVKNPYTPSVLGVGIIGSKYSAQINGKKKKEYKTWQNMLGRCNHGYKSYDKVTCCKEWLLYENFYEWLHKQENFDRWLVGDRWNIDKDILIKGNKIYSPDTCCLVPHNVNSLFVKSDAIRGELPVGVVKNGNGYQSYCTNPFTHKAEYIGFYSTPMEAFLAYKKIKEEYIKQVARIEFDNGNIIKSCYNAMMNYEVEITD